MENKEDGVLLRVFTYPLALLVILGFTNYSATVSFFGLFCFVFESILHTKCSGRLVLAYILIVLGAAVSGTLLFNEAVDLPKIKMEAKNDS